MNNENIPTPIKRYGPIIIRVSGVGRLPSLDERSEGEWVKYEDHRSAKELLENRIMVLESSMEIAWGVIANVSEGNWRCQRADWVAAAECWRDQHWHKVLSETKTGGGEEPCPATPAPVSHTTQTQTAQPTAVSNAPLATSKPCESGLHNPQGFTEEFIQQNREIDQHEGGWRVLNKDEIIEQPSGKKCLDEVESMFCGKWNRGWWGGLKERTFRTRLTPAELRKTRGLESITETSRKIGRALGLTPSTDRRALGPDWPQHAVEQIAETQEIRELTSSIHTPDELQEIRRIAQDSKEAELRMVMVEEDLESERNRGCGLKDKLTQADKKAADLIDALGRHSNTILADRDRYKALAEEAQKAKQPFKRDWINCPVCGDTDMRREWISSEEDGPYIFCCNVACASNGGGHWSELQRRLLPKNEEGHAPLSYETFVLLKRALETELKAKSELQSALDAANRETEIFKKTLESANNKLRDISNVVLPGQGDMQNREDFAKLVGEKFSEACGYAMCVYCGAKIVKTAEADVARLREALLTCKDWNYSDGTPHHQTFNSRLVKDALSSPAPDRLRELEDTARLDYICQHNAFISYSRDGDVCNVWLRGMEEDEDDAPAEGYPQKVYNDYREAIDAAIKAAGKDPRP